MSLVRRSETKKINQLFVLPDDEVGLSEYEAGNKEDEDPAEDWRGEEGEGEEELEVGSPPAPTDEDELLRDELDCLSFHL